MWPTKGKCCGCGPTPGRCGRGLLKVSVVGVALLQVGVGVAY